MSEDAQRTIEELLGSLEGLTNSPDDAIYTNKSYLNLLKNLNSALCLGKEITSTEAHRVLRMCSLYKMDMQCAPYVLLIISSLIKTNKAKTFAPVVDFSSSALAILEFLKKNSGEIKMNHLRKLSFQVLMSHPQAALIKLVNNHCRVLIETIELFLSTKSNCTLDVKIESFIFLQLLNLLPDREKSIFVKEGIPVWLSGVLPTMIETLSTLEDMEIVQTQLTYLELLSNALVKHDYFECPEWKYFLNNLVDPSGFHNSIKNMLNDDKDSWHRIWIVIIQLLKNDLTKPYGNTTPINAILPIVETAFKKNSVQRVRAFACWDELIRNFSKETNTSFSKRLKLVLVPLKLNNAKTEDAAIAKFNTWWLFIRKFKSQLEPYADLILKEFLYFLFGTKQYSRSFYWVGPSYERMRKMCLDAFVELIGHSDCKESKCTKIEPLCGTVVNQFILDRFWTNWLYALKQAVKMVVMNYKPETKSNIRCIWKSFFLLIVREIADIALRRKYFSELVGTLSVITQVTLSELAQDSVVYDDFFAMVIEDLTLPLFKDDDLQTQLISNSDEYRPMHTIVTLIMDKTFDSYFTRLSPQDLKKTLQPIVSNLLNESITNPKYTMQLLNDLPTTDNSLKLWTSLILSASESNLCLNLLRALLKWPFKVLQTATKVKDAAQAWYTIYNTVHVKLEEIEFSNDISKLLTKPVEDSRAANYFILFALIGVLKHEPDEDKMAKLEALTYEMNDYEEFEPLIPSLAETLTSMIENMSVNKYESLAQITINCVNNFMKLLNSATKLNVSNSILNRESAVSDVRTNILFINRSVLSDTIISALKSHLQKCTNVEIKKEIDIITSSYDQNDSIPITESSGKPFVAPEEFTSPKVQEVTKNKKKEASIVKTVVENGEEYIVVKSNWKFNPKNLTENQKEKFQRKRDIPALYQDLSQSQDEFKLSTWKTSSQDTSLSSSKSSKTATNNNASEILKTMPSTDVVPKIMENILDSAKTAKHKTCVDTSPVSNDKLLKVDNVACTPNSTKSPRMALQDRVFRNVRNLIQKSCPSDFDDMILDTVCKSPTHKLSTEKTNMSGTLNQVDSLSKNIINNLEPNKEDNETLVTKSPNATKNEAITATAKKDNIQNIQLVDLDYSPAIKTKKKTKYSESDVRPTRMKRVPKKFNDSLLLTFKKSRYSKNESQTNSQESSDWPEVTTAQVHATKDMNYNTEAQARITANEKDTTVKKVNVNETVTDNAGIVIIDGGNIESNLNEIDSLVTPTTPITSKLSEKSPEKPSSTVDYGIENAVTEVVTEEIKEASTVQMPLIKMKDTVIKTSPVVGKRVLTVNQFEKNPLLNKSKKTCTAQTEIYTEDDLSSAVSKLLSKSQCLNQDKSPVSKITLENNSDKEKIKEASTVLTPLIKIKDAVIKTSPVAGKRVLTVNQFKKNQLLNKSKKTCTAQTEIYTEDDLTSPVSKLLSKSQCLNQEKSPVSKITLENKTDKEEIKEASTVQTPLIKMKGAVIKTSPVVGKRVLTVNQFEKNPLLNKSKKTCTAQTEIYTEDDLASAVSKLLSKSQCLNQEKSPVSKITLEKKTDKEEIKEASTVQTPLLKMKDAAIKTSPVAGKRVLTVNQSEKNPLLNKSKKTCTAQTEIYTEDDLASAVSKLLSKSQCLNQEKSPVSKITLEKKTDKEEIKEASTVQTPLLKMKDAAIKTSHVAGKRVLTVNQSEKNPLLNKSKKTCTAQTEIYTEDDLTLPVSKLLSKSQCLNQEKSSVSKITLENRTYIENKMDKNYEKIESVSAPPSVSNEVREGQPKSAVDNQGMQIENNKIEENILNKTTTPKNKVEDIAPKLSMKKATRKTRIEKELMIDMVEGHPFLKAQSEKRQTRKTVMSVENSSKRKSLGGRLNKTKLETTPKSTKNLREKKILSNKATVTVEESQDKQTGSSPINSIIDEPPCSEDVIESSQDSTITTISVKSTKRSSVREVPMATQDLIKDSEMTDPDNEENEKTDIELPQNKTIIHDTVELTENMDTEPMIDVSVGVIVLNETESRVTGLMVKDITMNSVPVVGSETQELAEADTQPNNPENFIEFEVYPTIDNNQSPPTTAVSINNQSLPEHNSLTNIDSANEVSSPLKNDDIRKQDFLNNTLEISPIKTQSPEMEKKSPSPETSSDFLVIELSSPVHSNGEPFEKHGSPEFFTEDKVSPDKRDVSPPRPELAVTNTSPISSLSLKKNRPPVRSGGRAAQMLDLCVNSDLNITKVFEYTEPDEAKKAMTSTSARRNLRIAYKSVGENCDNSSDMNVDTEVNFLMLNRTLPTVTSSPSGPILKRKLVEITDEATTSPASKRKRVSFHDPPVSTSISVHKYIEPISLIRSPQSSAKKRFERQTRLGIKSSRKLENSFNLDSVLSKTVESFTEAATPTEDTQNISLDITPIAEIVKTSELNDTDPFYPDLVDCKDAIDAIATELSSSAMRELFVKELKGKVETIGDLAKMTELQINRLCIKAPKIKVTKKVLADYAAERPTTLIDTVVGEALSEPTTESISISKTANVGTHTDVVEVCCTSTQTGGVSVAHTSQQTEPDSKDKSDIMKLCEELDNDSRKLIAEILPPNQLIELLAKKCKDASTLCHEVLKYQSKDLPEDKKISQELSFIRDFLNKSYPKRELFRLCSELLEKMVNLS